MGCVQSSAVDEEAKARNDEIENQLKRDRMMAKNEIKMLLLGAGESGKSTVLKQMKLIHHGGYNEQERDSYKEIIYSNTIQSMRAIIDALPLLELQLAPQRSERKKWIHCFENVTALVFLVSLSEYDQMLYEDESVNRMQEALTLFDSICNSRWFVKTSIILFLNKIDLFAEKLPRSPLGDYFPDYNGGDDYDAACNYLLNRFVSLNQSAATKQIYAHYTCATDTNQIKFVLSAIQDILLQIHLRECGLL